MQAKTIFASSQSLFVIKAEKESERLQSKSLEQAVTLDNLRDTIGTYNVEYHCPSLWIHKLVRAISIDLQAKPSTTQCQLGLLCMEAAVKWIFKQVCILFPRP